MRFMTKEKGGVNAAVFIEFLKRLMIGSKNKIFRLRHRDLRPSVVLVRCLDPLNLAITGFGSARLSDFDLDIVSPPETTRYMAPEAIAGGVAAASDWWSLGILLLERLTGGACFEGVNEQAFLIHVITNGVPIPEGLDPSLNLLLRGRHGPVL
jgi:primosomal replication protein N''